MARRFRWQEGAVGDTVRSAYRQLEIARAVEICGNLATEATIDRGCKVSTEAHQTTQGIGNHHHQMPRAQQWAAHVVAQQQAGRFEAAQGFTS